MDVSCLKGAINIIFFLTLYLILEVGVLIAIILSSVIVAHWIIRSAVYVYSLDRDNGEVDSSDLEVCEIASSILVCWFIGALTLKWIRSWQSLMTPVKLQEFQEKSYPRLCGCLRNIIVPVLILLCICCQICTYFFKFYQYADLKKDPNVEIDQLVYKKYVLFVGSLWLMVYLLARIFRFYRDVEKTRIEKEVGMRIRRPTWTAYFECYYTLLAYELFLTDVTLLQLLGIGAIFQDDNKIYHWFPYIFACFIATGIGIVLADVEEHMPWLDNKLDQSQPYYRLIHWDVRLHLPCFFLLPLMSIVYFRNPAELNENQTDNLLHNLLHLAFISNIWGCINRGQTLFSYAIRGHFWNGRPRHHRFLRNQNQPPPDGNGRLNHTSSNSNRIFPQLIETSERGTDNYACGGTANHPSEGQIGIDVQNEGPSSRHRMLSFMKNIYSDYFPLNVSNSDTGTDRGSVSTGTCTSLLNRQNVDNGNVQVVVIEVPGPLPVAVSPQLEPSNFPEEECENSKRNLRVQINGEMEEVNLNSEVNVKGNSMPDKNNNSTSEMNATKKNEVTFSVETEEQTFGLKRGSSKLLD